VFIFYKIGIFEIRTDLTLNSVFFNILTEKKNEIFFVKDGVDLNAARLGWHRQGWCQYEFKKPFLSS
jgi:hypothetical protein